MCKVILITGASSGIGEICARFAVKAGHRIALAARSANKLDALVEEFGTEKAIALPTDVTDPVAQERMIATAVARFGRLDVVVPNAGLGASARGTEAGSVESFREMIEVNCLAVTYTAKFAYPTCGPQKGIWC